MAGGIDWFRWHHGSVTDPKFQLVARKAQARFGDVLTVWAFMLEAASASAARGQVGELDAEAIDCLLGAEDGTTQRILDAMQARSLWDGKAISAWEKRQPKRERDDDKSTERVQAFRQRQRTETPGNATERQETPRGEESREDITQPNGCVSVAKAPPTTRGTRLEAGWALPKAWGEWARAEYPHWSDETIRLIAATFADHWHAKAGKAGVMLSWESTWRNWCRSDITQRAHAPPKQSASKQSALESRNAQTARQLLESMQ